MSIPRSRVRLSLEPQGLAVRARSIRNDMAVGPGVDVSLQFIIAEAAAASFESPVAGPGLVVDPGKFVAPRDAPPECTLRAGSEQEKPDHNRDHYMENRNAKTPNGVHVDGGSILHGIIYGLDFWLRAGEHEQLNI
jgi:hypothetical protein